MRITLTEWCHDENVYMPLHDVVTKTIKPNQHAMRFMRILGNNPWRQTEFEKLMQNDQYFQNTGSCYGMDVLPKEDVMECCCPNCSAKSCCPFIAEDMPF